MARRVKVKEKWKGKDWYTVIAPKYFASKDIGQTPALDPNLVMGRVVDSSLMHLGGDPGKYYFKLSFKISELDGLKALTKFHGHICTRDFISRIVQNRTTRIDTNNIIALKDGKIRIKTIAITNRRVKAEISKKIRAFIVEKVKDIEKMTIEEFIKNITTNKLQIKIKKETNKLYPIRFFEFRKSEVLG